MNAVHSFILPILPGPGTDTQERKPPPPGAQGPDPQKEAPEKGHHSAPKTGHTTTPEPPQNARRTHTHTACHPKAGQPAPPTNAKSNPESPAHTAQLRPPTPNSKQRMGVWKDPKPTSTRPKVV
ncbi:hypothetical protein ILYODFUR_031877 [Ilyodon furcidens]|uniref:Uncharacterized protein n=1 Tax=Ilyodon furcidens TaxID=33524 RepID=A0ABV0V9Q4_9TELE